MLTIPHVKESLSRAYLTTATAIARHKLNVSGEFDYGVDGNIREVVTAGERRRESGIGFDFQAKSSCVWFEENDQIVYDLESKNYNDLVARSASNHGFPLFLVLLCLPEAQADWVSISHDFLSISKCAFYTQLSGDPTANAATKRIRIPTTNRFDPHAIRVILSDVRAGRI